MKNDNMKKVTESTGEVPEMRKTSVWESLRSLFLSKIQEYLQDLLNEEADDLVGRKRYERAKTEELNTRRVYRNGFGKSRALTTPLGEIHVQRPRIRGLEQRFESRVLPLFKRKTDSVGELLPELYLHGLATRDFTLALRGLLGDQAPLSPQSIQRLTAKWQLDFEEWGQRPLDGLDVVYVWVDGVYVKAGLEKDKAAVLVALAALSDGSKVILAVESGYRESTESWSGMLRSLRDRGLRCPRLVIGDGNLGLWSGLSAIYPEAEQQRCWNHRICNVLDKIPKKKQAQAKLLLRTMMYAETQASAEKLKVKFRRQCASWDCAKAADILDSGWERLVSYYNFPQEHWVHLRTTNPIESPFSVVRLRTDAAKRYKKAENAVAIIWKTLCVAQQTFRKLNAADLLVDVAKGMRYKDGAVAPATEAPRCHERREAA